MGDVTIKGGAGEFEAAVIAVVLDQIALEERVATERRGRESSELSGWMRAVRSEEPRSPLHDPPTSF